jgi:DDE family transposase
VKKTIGFYPSVRVDAAGSGVVSQAGGVLLTNAVRAGGLDGELPRVLAPWRKPLARHDPAKIVLDLAVALALGGDCLADIAVLRGAPDVFGLVASDPTVSRTVAVLAADVARVLAALNTARAAARARVWALTGEHAPDAGIDADSPIVIDTDATLLTAHSDKQGAAPTFKRGYGFHPLWAFVDHGSDGTGEPLAVMLRPGNAGSNTAADHIAVVRDALKQLPSYRPGTRPGRRVLVRADSAGCTHDFLDWVVSQRMSYSVGFTLPDDFADKLALIPDHVWAPAYDADGEVRDGAWVGPRPIRRRNSATLEQVGE